MATWNRQPTGDSGGRNSEGDTRSITWVAAGLLTVEDALTDASFPVDYNDAYPDEVSSKLKAKTIRVDAIGYRVMSATAEYSIPEDGEDHSPPNDESKPLVYTWSTVQVGVEIDRDATAANSGMGNALTSSVGLAVSGITAPKNYKRLVITRWETSYDLDQALEFENTVNSGVFEGADAGEVKCPIIQPNQSITVDSSLIGIDYNFDFKKEEIWGADPWQTQYVDRDSYAFADIDGTTELRRIITKSGESVTGALLDGLGVPLDLRSEKLTYRKTPESQPEAAPSWVAQTAPPGSTAITVGKVTFLRWLTAPLKDFDDLGFSA